MPCGFTPEDVPNGRQWWEKSTGTSEPCPRDTRNNSGRCIWHTYKQNKQEEDIQQAIEDESEDFIDFAYLEDAHASGVDFKDINFRSASFAGVNFDKVEFGGADYSGSTFENADLSDKDLYGSTFHHCNFERADLSEAELELVEFNGSNLRRAKIERIKCSQTNFAGANLEGAILTSSLLSEARFENARLRNAVLDNAKISEETFNETWSYEDEGRWDDAASVYRALMTLARENTIPQLARTFYFRHKQCRRHQYRQEAGLCSLNQLRNSAAWLRAEGSRFVIGYGDRPIRVIVTSGLIIVISAFGYIRLEGIQQNGSPVIPNTCQSIFDYLYFSAITFITLGYSDFQTVGTLSKILVMGEALLGALFMALLVFVLGRRITW